MIKKVLLTAVIASTLVGCAAQQQALRENQTKFTQTIPVCTDEKDCTAKWEAAQLWIVKNAGYKLQTVTNVLLETYNPAGSSTNLAVRVIKEPVGGGKYQLLVRTWCDNLFGCTPDSWAAALDFNQKIGAVTAN